ncbi:unnamed protein product [Ascophyllum nodosum]
MDQAGTSLVAHAREDNSDHDPFEVLRIANNTITQNIRREEVSPDLKKQLTQTGMSASAQAYFCEPYMNSYLGPQIRQKSLFMLPEPLVRERDRVQCTTFMGLLPEIDHVWMSVDNVLFLWNYHTQDLTQFRKLQQVIVTVALVAPRRGVLKDAVKHLLAVSTTQEVALLAVTYPDGSGSGRTGRIEVRQTSFVAPTNGVAMTKIAGHANGRAFMAGRDGNLYELCYSVRQNFTYATLGFGDPTVKKTCERRLHKPTGGGNPLRAALALFGYRDLGRIMVDVVVDSLLNVLYTLDKDGNIDLFDLGAQGNQTTQKIMYFNLRKAAAKFCRWTNSPLLPPASLFKDPKEFQVVSLDLVDPSESKGISLVAVSDLGMRFYLSCGHSGESRNNFRLEIIQIKCPPPESLWRYLRERRGHQGEAGQTVTQPPDGFAPKWERHGSGTGASASVYEAYCCQGVLVMAQAIEARDRLVFVGPDLVTRSKRRREAHQGEHPWMREAVSDGGGLVQGTLGMGRVWALGERPVTLADDPEGARVRSLLLTSAAPSQSEINDTVPGSNSSVANGASGGSSGAIAWRMIKQLTASPSKRQRQLSFPERPIVPGPPTVNSPGGSAGFTGGLLPKDVEKMVALSELSTQLFSSRRELLCLMSAGLQVFTRLRPIDLLYDLLAQNLVEKVSFLFDDFGPDQSAAMCFSIACGLPRDLGIGMDLPYSAGVSNQAVRNRALNAAIANCKPPSFVGPQRGGIGMGVGFMMNDKFINSSLHNGLQLFISRLLRPFWFRSVVTVPSPSNGGGSGSKRSADGTIRDGGHGQSAQALEVLDLETLRVPLDSLRASIRTVFPRAVSEDLAAVASQEAAAAATKGGRARRGTVAETPRERHKSAKEREVLEVHAAYRLVSRTLEMVRVAGVLRRASREGTGAKISWSTLHGISLCKLVTGEEEHRRMSALLSELVVGEKHLPAGKRVGCAEELGGSCAAFFGRGDRMACEGVELLRRAGDSAGRGAALLAEAAKDWHGKRALGDGGQLALACEALTGAGMFEAAVDVCMTCAQNFVAPRLRKRAPYGGGGVEGREGRADGPASGKTTGDGGVADWEEGIYHGGGMIDVGERDTARLECFERAVGAVVGALKLPLPVATAAERGRRAKVDKVIARCQSYDAPKLHEMLFRALEDNDRGILLSLENPRVEHYLRKDPELLFRYYMLHESFPKAVQVMFAEARADPRKDTRIRHRLECLAKAISACHKCDLASAQTVGPGFTVDHVKLRALEDTNDVLMAQERLLTDLRESVKPLELLKAEGRGAEDMDEVLRDRVQLSAKMETTIMEPTELYQEASKACLWEGCLLLMKCCGSDQPVIVERLIRSVIWREVPHFSRSGVESEAHRFLVKRRDRPRDLLLDSIREEVKMKGKTEVTGQEKNLVGFEDDSWFLPMLNKVRELSRELLAGKWCFRLPVEMICEELEAIADAFLETGGSVNPLDIPATLRRAGVPAAVLCDAYNRIAEARKMSDDSAMRLRRLEVIVQCLQWTSEGLSGQRGVLSETVRPETVRKWVADALRNLESLGSSDNEQGQVDALKGQLIYQHNMKP